MTWRAGFPLARAVYRRHPSRWLPSGHQPPRIPNRRW